MRANTLRNDISIRVGGISTEYRIRYQEIGGNKAGWYIYQGRDGNYFEVWAITGTLAEAFGKIGQSL